MKNTTKILATTLVCAIIATWISSTYAMNWEWNWQGKWQWQWNWSWQHSSQSKHSWNPWDMIKDIAPSDLSEQEKLDLAYQYSEEMVARDAYNYFYYLYNEQTFKNIAESEQQHMDSVKVLLDRYSLPTPTTYGELQDEFDTLKAEWEKGLKEALEVGLKIEMLDIEDIKDTIKSTDNDDIKIVFTNIWWASYNHMRGFAKSLENNNLVSNVDFSKYLTKDEVNTKWSLKYKLSESLVKEWVVLPSQASAKNIQANCEKEEKTTQIRQNYKKQIDEKYWNSLKNSSKEKIEKIEAKVDQKIQETEENQTLSQSLKEKYLNVYHAFREYLRELF